MKKVNIFFIFPYHLKFILHKLDVRMNSPPASPPRFELSGASRVTGGTFHG